MRSKQIRSISSFFIKVVTVSTVFVLICSLGLNVSLPWVKEQRAYAADTNVVKVGEAVPAFSLQGIDGKQYKIGGKAKQGNEGDVAQKPVWIHFWASWCGPCQSEAPDIEELTAKYKDKLDAYGINATMYDNEQDVKAFVEKYKLTFPVLKDEQGDIFKLFRGAALPTHVFIDGNGIVKEIKIGSLSKEQLQAKLDTIVNDIK
ncbi:thiol-disulfide isomerase/thioredoxin [Paenibacillus turicensis]|uniref:Thiol-disulfide isomerase/thioredoxin n=1 Tax=Paenibacillus turicensis TaxID=160487 RepID=A0ABS4FTM2_9BACL|nr:TlpA disulfide reductase family protein [Paenibacillus turicensis]MBP1905911.1 thiol-disulfide isomerase/thioredoxin [Paenibacillus turicensis]